MNKLLILLTFLFSLCSEAQILKDIFKYSTLYASYSENTPLFMPEQYFVTQGGDVVNITPEQSNDYMITYGFRKIARFGYENKENRFYDGSENLTSLNSNIGNVKGLEYLFQYSKGRQQGREFESHRYFLRYIAKYWSTKLEWQENGIINLNYKSADVRFRVPLGKKFSLSLGAVYRTHLPYGYNPIDDYLDTYAWWDLAYQYGYMDHYYGIDYDNDGQLDNFDWWWSNEAGERVADTDLDFRKNNYRDIVNHYNRTELDKIGELATLSGVLGFDFYHYRDRFWVHAWGNYLPIHKHIDGNEDFSYERYVGSDRWEDYNTGLMFGWFLTKKIGIYTEYEQTQFWDKNLQYLKAGINIRL